MVMRLTSVIQMRSLVFSVSRRNFSSDSCSVFSASLRSVMSVPNDSVPTTVSFKTSVLFFQEMMRSSPDLVSMGFSKVSAMVPCSLHLLEFLPYVRVSFPRHNQLKPVLPQDLTLPVARDLLAGLVQLRDFSILVQCDKEDIGGLDDVLGIGLRFLQGFLGFLPISNVSEEAQNGCLSLPGEQGDTRRRPPDLSTLMNDPE